MKSPKFRVELRSSVLKDIDRTEIRYRPKIWDKIEALADVPTPRGSLKLSGDGNVYRIRIGVFRVFNEIDYKAKMVIVGHVMHRQTAYKKK